MIRSFILIVILVSAAVSAADLPSDPDGVTVMDRDLCRMYTPGVEHVIYITLYNDPEGRGTIELQSGIRLQDGWHWESICSWNPVSFTDEPIVFDPPVLLSVQQLDTSLLITWIDRLDYREGMASLYLEYDMATGDHTEFFSD